MKYPGQIDRLSNLGKTDAGSAIVDAIWFSSFSTMGVYQIGIVLICDQALTWKAYIGVASLGLDEKSGAKEIAAMGAKVDYAIAAAAFPDRFTCENYDPKSS